MGLGLLCAFGVGVAMLFQVLKFRSTKSTFSGFFTPWLRVIAPDFILQKNSVSGFGRVVVLFYF